MVSSVFSPQVEFRISLPEILLADLMKIPLAPFYEGYSQWVYTSCATLSADLRAELETVFAFVIISGTFQKWLIEFPEDDPIQRDFSAFVARLEALSEKEFRGFLRSGLELKLGFKLEGSAEEISIPSFDDPEAVRTLLQEVDLYADTLKAQLREIGRYEEFMERDVELICSLAGLKGRLVSGIVHFWEEIYREEYERALPVMERSVEHHRNQNYIGDFPTIFKAITGRRLPESLYRYLSASRVIFLPSCHGGLHVGAYIIEERPPLLLVTYNCRLTGMQKSPASSGE